MSLPAIAAVSATSLLAQSSLGGPAQRATADVNSAVSHPGQHSKSPAGPAKEGDQSGSHRWKVRAPVSNDDAWRALTCAMVVSVFVLADAVLADVEIDHEPAVHPRSTRAFSA
jgi:hypothetical protein